MGLGILSEKFGGLYIGFYLLFSWALFKLGSETEFICSVILRSSWMKDKHHHRVTQGLWEVIWWHSYMKNLKKVHMLCPPNHSPIEIPLNWCQMWRFTCKNSCAYLCIICNRKKLEGIHMSKSRNYSTLWLIYFVAYYEIIKLFFKENGKMVKIICVIFLLQNLEYLDIY